MNEAPNDGATHLLAIQILVIALVSYSDTCNSTYSSLCILFILQLHSPTEATVTSSQISNVSI